MKYYRGFYCPAYPAKYNGDPSKIIYRSSWELSVFAWCDTNPNVIQWASEEYFIWYRSYWEQNRRAHRYYPDLKITLKDGRVLVIEIKPKSQTEPPRKRQRRTQKYLQEIKTFMKNQDKWKAAKKWCEDRNYSFQIWTEDVIQSLGIPLIK